MKNLIVIIIIVFSINHTLAQQAKIDSLRNIINTTNSDSVKLISYLRLYGKIKYQYPDSNRKLYEEAIKFAKEKKHKMTIAGLYNDRAISFGVYRQNDSSIHYLNKAIAVYASIDSLSPRLSQCYTNLGSVYSSMGYFNTATKYNLKSLQHAEKLNDTVKIALRTHNLSASFNNMKEHQKALFYAMKAYKIYKHLPNSRHKVNNLLALEAIYSEFGLLDSTLYFADKAEKEALKINYMQALPYVYYNKGYIYLKKKKYDKAKNSLFITLQYCDSVHDEANKFFAFSNLSEIFTKEKQYEKTKEYLKKELYFANNQNNVIYKVNAYENAYKYYKAINDLGNALKYMELYKQWSDTALNKEKYKQIAEMDIIYETAKKEQIIKLQEKENIIQKTKLEQKTILIWLVISLSAVVIIVITAYIIVRLQKQKAETLKLQMEAQDNTKKEIASELHSGIGSELTATILHLENSELCEEETENLKKIYSHIRTASHLLSLPTFVMSTIEDEINQLVTNFRTDKLNIETNIFSKTAWKNVSPVIQQNIYRIVQELFTNTMKHSQADFVELQLIKNNNIITLSYEDNGKGYNPQEILQSKGYRDEIITRTKILKGTVVDDSKINKGAILTFKFPV